MVKDLVKNLCVSLETDIGGVSGATSRKVVVATPVITLTDNSVTITCDTTGATIYYTLDGSTPTSSSAQYSAAFTLDSSCTIKAIAIKGGKSSGVAEKEYVKPITYLTQWKIVGNSEVHTLPYPDGVVLPTGYKRCKYLEFHGTEYIDSGIIPEQGIGVSMTFKYLGEYTEEIRDDGFFGCRVSAYSADSLYCFRQAQTNKLLVSYGGKICDSTTTGNFRIDAGDEIELHLDSNSLSFTNGTNTFTQSHNYQITKGTNTLYIGRTSGYGYPSRILLRIFILTNSVGDTIFNGIPCLDDNDVPCLYDTVSGTSFYNDGTGTLGYEIEPQPTEIWSCGEYSDVDSKYHVVILPTDKQAVDIVLDEPLRKTGNTADTLEYPTETSGKALLTIRVEESGGELSPLDTPTTELIDAPQIAEADSYTCVISQGAKAVEWSSFETD